MSEPDPRFCETCRKRLTLDIGPDGMTYVHSPPASHPAIPRRSIELDWIDDRCGYCRRNKPRWTYALANEITLTVRDSSRTLRRGTMASRMSACTTCALYIDARDAEGLTARLVRSLVETFGVPPDDATYSTVVGQCLLIVETTLSNIESREPYVPPTTKGKDP